MNIVPITEQEDRLHAAYAAMVVHGRRMSPADRKKYHDLLKRRIEAEYKTISDTVGELLKDKPEEQADYIQAVISDALERIASDSFSQGQLETP